MRWIINICLPKQHCNTVSKWLRTNKSIIVAYQTTPLLLLLKPAAQAQVRKTKFLINCFHNPTTPAPRKTKEITTLVNQPMVDCTLESIQPSRIKHSVGKVIPQLNLSWQERPSKLGWSTPWYFKLQWMSCGCSLWMSNSSRSRWKLAEQIGISVQINLVEHTMPSHTKSMTQWQETLIGTKRFKCKIAMK